MSLRDKLLAEQKALAPVEFTVSTGEKVHIRRFNGVQRGEWDLFHGNAFNADGKLTNPGVYRAKLVQLSLSEPDGALAFANTDVALVQSLRGSFLEEVFIESARVNLLTYGEVLKARENFLKTQATASSTGSPGNAEKPTPNASGKS